jgi:DNA-directed RNA polymerase specialized sigma24 family protein
LRPPESTVEIGGSWALFLRTHQTMAMDAHDLIQHVDFVRRLARGLLDEAGDDVAQDAMVVALERPPRDRATLRNWLARVVHRLAWIQGRETRRRAARERRAARPEAPR